MNLDPILLVVNFIAFFLALTVHEFSHALVAYLYGDKTAAYEGRLTLNPIAHIDLFGTILLPLLLIISQTGIVFGWAKPVPVNYYNLKNQKWGPAIVSLAGPAANLVFLIFSLILWNLNKYYLMLPQENLLVQFVSLLIIVNSILMIFNLLPIFPLDGSKLLFAILPDRYENFKIFWERNGVLFLIILMIFGSGFLNLLFGLFLGLLTPFM
ncbi:MAG: site-2 protease family protein [Candidatus Parcubacteria bacterium]|nr:site-2 protease family protein [Candidatus Parcubacteria bacterium]